MLETLALDAGARVAKWQTQRTQNPPGGNPREGSNPSPGTTPDTSSVAHSLRRLERIAPSLEAADPAVH
jgi:hypothetical protein